MTEKCDCGSNICQACLRQNMLRCANCAGFSECKQPLDNHAKAVCNACWQKRERQKTFGIP
jgi:hypothetical protein